MCTNKFNKGTLLSLCGDWEPGINQITAVLCGTCGFQRGTVRAEN